MLIWNIVSRPDQRQIRMVEKISSKAIELTNAEVEKISHFSKEQASSKKTCGTRPNKYLVLSPFQI